MSEHETATGSAVALDSSNATADHEGGEQRQPLDEHAVQSPPVPDAWFTSQEITQFDLDDSTAGRDIGKMLALFFLYTVIVMSFVGYWTWTVAD